ncbi:hypothetical protein [uncultured Polaribacter sp.]|uniref:hypothetical protein n=1 Tax=uncultured Polaribacter sp. TaxID=174711 RepID=UPI002634C7B7|nr:hypothetical protein [uncultured Polaribacter sp.]
MESKNKNNNDFFKSIKDKNSGFTTPENYFSNIEDKLTAAIFEEQLPTKSGLKVPTNYFENVENKIRQKLEKQNDTKVVSLKAKVLKYVPLSVAASIVLILSINYLTTSKQNLNFNTIAHTDIENWIVNNSTALTTEDFATILNTEIMNEDDFVFTELNNDAIEDYLLNTDHSYLPIENY